MLITLLAVSVLIVLIGVANGFSLSVIERTRESATLRAIGMTKGQLRRSLAVESLILSVTSTIAGLAVGAFFGWFGSVIVLKGVFGGLVFSFNWGISAGAILLISVVTALISSVAPALPGGEDLPVEVLSGRESRPGAAHNGHGARCHGRFRRRRLRLLDGLSAFSGAYTAAGNRLSAFCAVTFLYYFLFSPVIAPVSNRALGIIHRTKRKNANRTQSTSPFS